MNTSASLSSVIDAANHASQAVLQHHQHADHNHDTMIPQTAPPTATSHGVNAISQYYLNPPPTNMAPAETAVSGYSAMQVPSLPTVNDSHPASSSVTAAQASPAPSAHSHDLPPGSSPSRRQSSSTYKSVWPAPGISTSSTTSPQPAAPPTRIKHHPLLAANGFVDHYDYHKAAKIRRHQQETAERIAKGQDVPAAGFRYARERKRSEETTQPLTSVLRELAEQTTQHGTHYHIMRKDAKQPLFVSEIFENPAFAEETLQPAVRPAAAGSQQHLPRLHPHSSPAAAQPASVTTAQTEGDEPKDAEHDMSAAINALTEIKTFAHITHTHNDKVPDAVPADSKGRRFAGPAPVKSTTSIPAAPIGKRKHEANFLCTICDKTFTQKEGLVKHQRLHSGAKPFICYIAICRKAFAQQANLQRHMMDVHDDFKPYFCIHGCDKRFKRKQHWKTHIANHHHLNPTDEMEQQSREDREYTFTVQLLDDPTSLQYDNNQQSADTASQASGESSSSSAKRHKQNPTGPRGGGPGLSDMRLWTIVPPGKQDHYKDQQRLVYQQWLRRQNRQQEVEQVMSSTSPSTQQQSLVPEEHEPQSNTESSYQSPYAAIPPMPTTSSSSTLPPAPTYSQYPQYTVDLYAGSASNLPGPASDHLVTSPWNEYEQAR